MSLIQRLPVGEGGLSKARVMLGAGLMFAAVVAPTGSAQASVRDGAWGFEQVTPTNKAGGNVSAVDTFRANADGSRLLYTATAPFAGAPVESSPLYVRYVAQRTNGGWGTTATDPPFDLIPPAYNNYIMGTVASSANLAHVMVTSTRALTPGATEGGSNIYLRNAETGQLTLVATHPDVVATRDLASPSGATNVFYIAPDGNGALFGARDQLTPDAPAGGTFVLYGWTREDGLHVVSRLPSSEGGAAVGGNTAGNNESGVRRAIATDDALNRVYFRAEGSASGVYLREAGNSRAISRSELSGDVVDAQILASNADGRYALIGTLAGGEPLTADTPVDPDPVANGPSYLYRYSRDTEDLEYVGTINPNGFPTGQALQMSADGRTIVFQSGFELLPGAVAGTSNMFVWRNGDLRFITSSPVMSGAASAATFLRLLSTNGRYFAFTDSSPSTFAQADADAGAAVCVGSFGVVGLCNEVFLYDAETNDLSCASCRPVGVPQRGASGDPSSGDLGFIRMDQHQPQNVSNDGTVWFTSQNDLLPAEDSNGLADVYASRDGEMRLVSRARQGMSSRFLEATADGGVVFISTNDAIRATDTDSEVDIYATGPRIEVQNDPAPVPSQDGCSGADCRGTSAPQPGNSGAPVSATNAGEQPTRPSRGSKASVEITRSRWTGSTGRVSVRVSGDGRIRVTGKGLAGASRHVTRAGMYVIRVRLSKSSRATRKRSGRVMVRMRASFDPPFGRSAATTSRKVVR